MLILSRMGVLGDLYADLYIVSSFWLEAILGYSTQELEHIFVWWVSLARNYDLIFSKKCVIIKKGKY